MDIVALFPGQGSQTPGMGRDLAEAFPEARAVFDAADGALGIDLRRLCFEGPEDELTLTHNAQPALLAHSAAIWAVLRTAGAPHVRAGAGHSLGEFSAYQAAGAIGLLPALRLVRTRGELMYRSGLERPGAMAAILGNPSVPIEELCRQAASIGIVVPANYNSPGQVVISGEADAVERVMALAREAGAKRAVRLNVSGAFHSPLMRAAADGLREALACTEFADPQFPVYANVNAAPVRTGAVARALLLEQLTAPVRWTDVVKHLASEFPGAPFVELGPGTVLGGLVKKIAPDVTVLSCGTATEVSALRERFAG